MTNIFYPILTAFGVVFLVNISIYPEFSSSELEHHYRDPPSDRHHTEGSHRMVYRTGGGPGHLLAETRSETTTSVAATSATEADGSDSTSAPDTEKSRVARLAALTVSKGKIRAALDTCLDAYQECTFEVTYSFLPPRSLKSISKSDERDGPKCCHSNQRL